MTAPGTVAIVTAKPPCDFCGKPAFADFKTYTGPWASGCYPCFKKYGPGEFGTGVGQKYKVSA